MAYAETLNAADRGKSIVAVAGVHIGVVGLLVVGLTVHGEFAPKPDSTWVVGTIKDPPKPPPPKPDERKKPKDSSLETKVVVTKPPFDLPLDPPELGKTTTVTGPVTPPNPYPDGTGDTLGKGTGEAIIPTPKSAPIFDPIAAKPSNDPSSWIRDRDYRSSWIRRGMAGTARFQLGVGTNGRVTQCTITRSTGHGALDKATCDLITKRARFAPARGNDGAKTNGSYSSSINWILPN